MEADLYATVGGGHASRWDDAPPPGLTSEPATQNGVFGRLGDAIAFAVDNDCQPVYCWREHVADVRQSWAA